MSIYPTGWRKRKKKKVPNPEEGITASLTTGSLGLVWVTSCKKNSAKHSILAAIYVCNTRHLKVLPPSCSGIPRSVSPASHREAICVRGPEKICDVLQFMSQFGHLGEQ